MCKNHSKDYYVYIMTNNSGTLYTGMSGHFARRIYQHKNRLIKGFSRRYNIERLVYYEQTNYVFTALEREKEIKGWSRKKKIALIEGMNPEWKDLAEDLDIHDVHLE